MSNEELVALIQKGNDSLMLQLWDNVIGLVRKFAYRLYGEIIPDPKALATLSAVDDRIWHDQLREVLGEMMMDMPEKYSDVLYRRFWLEQTYTKAGEEIGIAAENVRKNEWRGLRYLRQPQNRKRLRPFYEFDCYSGTGMGAFKSSGASVQERYVMWNV